MQKLLKIQFLSDLSYSWLGMKTVLKNIEYLTIIELFSFNI